MRSKPEAPVEAELEARSPPQGEPELKPANAKTGSVADDVDHEGSIEKTAKKGQRRAESWEADDAEPMSYHANNRLFKMITHKLSFRAGDIELVNARLKRLLNPQNGLLAEHGSKGKATDHREPVPGTGERPDLREGARHVFAGGAEELDHEQDLLRDGVSRPGQVPDRNDVRQARNHRRLRHQPLPGGAHAA